MTIQRAMRCGVLGLTASLSAGSVYAATVVQPEMLHPRDQSDGVAPNTSLILRFPVSPILDDDSLQDAVGLLNSNDERLSLGQLTVVAASNGFHLASAPLSLAKNATYRLLSRISRVKDDCSEEMGPAPCIVSYDDAEVIAEFTTGDQLDEQPPEMLDWDGSADIELGPAWPLASCSWKVTVSAADDQTSGAAIRYQLAGDALQRLEDPQLATDGELHIFLVPGGPAQKDGLAITPVDASNNAGEAIRVDVPECPYVYDSPNAGSDFIMDPPPAPEPAQACSLTPRPSVASPFLMLCVAFALASFGIRRGQRQP